MRRKSHITSSNPMTVKISPALTINRIWPFWEDLPSKVLTERSVSFSANAMASNEPPLGWVLFVLSGEVVSKSYVVIGCGEQRRKEEKKETNKQRRQVILVLIQ